MHTNGQWLQDNRLSFAARGVLAFLSPSSVPTIGAFVLMETILDASPSDGADDAVEALLELELYGYVWFDGKSKFTVMDPFRDRTAEILNAMQPALIDLNELADQL